MAPLPGTISGRHAAALGLGLYGISASSQHPRRPGRTHRVLVRRSDAETILPRRPALHRRERPCFPIPTFSLRHRNSAIIWRSCGPRRRAHAPRFILRCRICCSGISAAPGCARSGSPSGSGDHRCSHQPAAGPDEAVAMTPTHSLQSTANNWRPGRWWRPPC